jgi:hypothetical protein
VLEQLADLRKPCVDPDDRRASFRYEVVAERPAPVQLDHEPSEVAQFLLTRLEQRTALPAEEARALAARAHSVVPAPAKG